MTLAQKRQHWFDADDNEVYASELRTSAAAYIAALEHVLKQTTAQREHAATKRAEQAEAELAALTEVARKRHNDWCALKTRLANAHEELDTKNAQLDEYEAALAERDKRIADLEYTRDFLLRARAEEGSE